MPSTVPAIDESTADAVNRLLAGLGGLHSHVELLEEFSHTHELHGQPMGIKCIKVTQQARINVVMSQSNDPLETEAIPGVVDKKPSNIGENVVARVRWWSGRRGTGGSGRPAPFDVFVPVLPDGSVAKHDSVCVEAQQARSRVFLYSWIPSVILAELQAEKAKGKKTVVDAWVASLDADAIDRMLQENKVPVETCSDGDKSLASRSPTAANTGGLLTPVTGILPFFSPMSASSNASTMGRVPWEREKLTLQQVMS